MHACLHQSLVDYGNIENSQITQHALKLAKVSVFKMLKSDTKRKKKKKHTAQLDKQQHQTQSFCYCVWASRQQCSTNNQSLTKSMHNNAFGQLCLKTLQDAVVKMWSTTAILNWRQSILHSGTDSTLVCRQSASAEAGHTFSTGVRGWRLAG